MDEAFVWKIALSKQLKEEQQLWLKAWKEVKYPHLYKTMGNIIKKYANLTYFPQENITSNYIREKNTSKCWFWNNRTVKSQFPFMLVFWQTKPVTPCGQAVYAVSDLSEWPNMALTNSTKAHSVTLLTPVTGMFSHIGFRSLKHSSTVSRLAGQTVQLGKWFSRIRYIYKSIYLPLYHILYPLLYYSSSE